jgi:hypothetical protein
MPIGGFGLAGFDKLSEEIDILSKGFDILSILGQKKSV